MIAVPRIPLSMIKYTKEGSLPMQSKIKGSTIVTMMKGLANKNTLEVSGDTR